MFRELYYWMYMYLRRIKTNDTPAINAYFLICLLQGFNIETITVLVSYILKYNTREDRNTAIYIGLGLTVVLFIVNYFLLYTQKKVIFEKYEEALPAKKIKGQIYFWLYVILSFVIFFVAVANLVTPKY